MALVYIGSTQRTRMTRQDSTTQGITVANNGALIVANVFMFTSGGCTLVVSDGQGTYR